VTLDPLTGEPVIDSEHETVGEPTPANEPALTGEPALIGERVSQAG
jgi:hypothetical protein